MKLAPALACVLAASPLRAETFICEFTEPFVTLKYSTVTQELMRVDDLEKKTSVLSSVVFEVAGPGEFYLRSPAEGRGSSESRWQGQRRNVRKSLSV
jgi:hypothetical protein